MVGCMMPGERKQNKQKHEEVSDKGHGNESMVCNMIGEVWESLLFPITIDSGACASVMPSIWCNHVPIKETQEELYVI